MAGSPFPAGLAMPTALRGGDATWYQQMALPTSNVASWFELSRWRIGHALRGAALEHRHRRHLADVEEDEEAPGIIFVIFAVPALFMIMWYVIGIIRPHQVVPT